MPRPPLRCILRLLFPAALCLGAGAPCAHGQAVDREEVLAGLREREAVLSSISFHVSTQVGSAATEPTGPGIAEAPDGQLVLRAPARNGTRELWAVLRGPFQRISLRMEPDQPLSVMCRTPEIRTSISPQPSLQVPFVGTVNPVALGAGDTPDMDSTALWANGFLVSPERGLPWSEYMKSPDWTLVADTWNGEAAVRAERNPILGTVERYWFLPGRDWAVARWEHALDPHALTAAMEVEEWQRAGDAVWLAARWRRQNYYPRVEGREPQIAFEERSRVDEVRLAPEADESVFAPDLIKELPLGSWIIDHRLGGCGYWTRELATPERLDDVAAYIDEIATSEANARFHVPDELWQYRGAAGLESTWCGPQCLSLMLRLRDVRIEASELAGQTGWTPEAGATLAGLAEGAAQHGVALKELRPDYAGLVALGAPAIVKLNYGHVILFVAERDRKVYFVEPPDVIFSMKPDRFRAIWTGEALTFDDAAGGE